MIGRLVPFQLVSKTQSETKPTQVAWQGGAWAMSKTVTPRFPPDPTRLSSQTGGQVAPNISTGHQPTTNANSQPKLSPVTSALADQLDNRYEIFMEP